MGENLLIKLNSSVYFFLVIAVIFRENFTRNKHGHFCYIAISVDPLREKEIY